MFLIDVINEITFNVVVYLLSICLKVWMYGLKYPPTFIYRDKASAGNRIWYDDYCIISSVGLIELGTLRAHNPGQRYPRAVPLLRGDPSALGYR